MGIDDNIRHEADAAKERMKEEAGMATDSEKLKADGMDDESQAATRRDRDNDESS